MATVIIINKPPLATFLPLSKATITRASLHLPISPAVRFSGELCRRKTRGLSVVTRAGPSTSSYVFAFVFPLSLLAVTIFTSLRVDDKLEREFREEVRGSKTSWLLKFCGLLLCLKLGFVWGCVDLKLGCFLGCLVRWELEFTLLEP